MLRQFAKILSLMAVLLPGTAQAAVFYGEFWDANIAISNLGVADSIIAGGPATATFQSTGIDYPRGTTNGTRTVNSGRTTLAQFLGPDAGSIVGPSTSSLTRSVFRFTGYLDLLPTVQSFSIRSDDGFRLTIGGQVIQQFNARGFAATTANINPGTGPVAFELIFFENGGNTGVEFLLDGTVAIPAAAPISEVPLPAGLPLIAAAMGALGLLARQRPV